MKVDGYAYLEPSGVLQRAIIQHPDNLLSWFRAVKYGSTVDRDSFNSEMTIILHADKTVNDQVVDIARTIYKDLPVSCRIIGSNIEEFDGGEILFFGSHYTDNRSLDKFLILYIEVTGNTMTGKIARIFIAGSDKEYITRLSEIGEKPIKMSSCS